MSQGVEYEGGGAQSMVGRIGEIVIEGNCSLDHTRGGGGCSPSPPATPTPQIWVIVFDRVTKDTVTDHDFIFYHV